MSETEVLKAAAARAIDYIEGLDDVHVGPRATARELRARLDKPLQDAGLPAQQVVEELAHDIADGLLASTNGRFFGWVIGGALPAAIAADWLTSAWDQNAPAYASSPAAAMAEDVCGAWLKELLGLPASASFAVVTGCQMAHTTALAAARHKVLAERGWDVEAQGLGGSPPIRVLVSENRHESIVRSIRLLGLGTEAIEPVACDDGARLRLEALAAALEQAPKKPTIVCLQAGDLNTGAFDPFAEACRIAHDVGAWVHVDGAFGLWAAASPRYRHLLKGVEEADSWATDGHKWLNVPYDCGFAFVADPAAHSAAFTQAASYSIAVEGVRDQRNWNPEWSRRARAFPTYVAIRALGRDGIARIVERCCAMAEHLTLGIGKLPGAEVLARPQINQGLVRFLADDGDHDRWTEAVVQRIQAEGTAWFGSTTWRGMRVMRISVCNWRTDEDDIERTIAAVDRALSEANVD